MPETAWWAFLVWSAIGFVVMPLGIDGTTVAGSLAPGAARGPLAALLRISDAMWIYLAAVVIYLHTATSEGLPTARRWAAILLLGSGCFEWIGVQTGFPFGPYRYTDNFGWRIGGVLPVAIPLAWMVVILCGRALVLHLRPTATRFELAFGVGFVAAITDVNLEAVAWKVRHYWNWYPDDTGARRHAWPPLQNYLSWFFLSVLLAYLLPPNYALRTRPSRHPWRPIIVLGTMNALFLVVYAARWAQFRN